MLPTKDQLNTGYDAFLTLSGWANAAMYGGLAAVLLTLCWYFNVESRFWLPLLAIYGIGAIAHILGFGLMALNVQMKISTDIVVDRMNHLAKERGKRGD